VCLQFREKELISVLVVDFEHVFFFPFSFLYFDSVKISVYEYVKLWDMGDANHSISYVVTKNSDF
jgi:hypothetical protein